MEYIPNFSEAFALRFNAFLASNATNITINANGTLGSLNANLDSTEAIPAVTNLIGTLLSEGADAQENLLDSEVRAFDFVFGANGTVTLREISGGVIKTRSTRVQPASQPQPADGLEQVNQ